MESYATSRGLCHCLGVKHEAIRNKERCLLTTMKLGIGPLVS